MAVEYAIFDLYHLLVEQIFGNFLLTIISVTAVFALICFILRMSMILTLSFLSLFVTTMIIKYYGALGGVLSATIIFIYLSYEVVRWMEGAE